MTEQFALTLLAASAGFAAAVFFCIGSAFNSSQNIAAISSTYWGVNPALARSLASQRGQYVAGGLLLVIAFGLQIWAALASSANPVVLPQWIGSWLCLVLVGTATTFLLGFAIAGIVYTATMRKALVLMKIK